MVLGSDFPERNIEQKTEPGGPAVECTTKNEYENGLPIPSPEQKSIIDAIGEGKCVTVQACAGSGKTTCMLQIASSLPPDRNVLIVTYNRSLADDCKARIQNLSLSHNRVRCYTIHGLVSKVAGKVCNDDHHLIKVLHEWDRLGAADTTQKALPLDLVMLDEAQDLRPLFHRCLSHILGRSRNSLQLCLVGDPKQLLYDFPTYGSDKASVSFFLEPQKHWGRFSQKRTWVNLPLSVSYRLTPNIACFCNLFWGTSMIGGNTKSPNQPVEYLLKYGYPNKAIENDPNKLSTSFLARIIDLHGPENVLFLAQSVKNVDAPIRVHVNELMKIKDPSRKGYQKYNFHIKESARGFEGNSDWNNKVRVWTFCGSKGCEADVVVVFGLELFQKPHGLNQIGVALSRARKRLIVLHGKSWRKESGQFVPKPFYPLLGDYREGMIHNVKFGEQNAELLTLEIPQLKSPECDYTDRSELTRQSLLKFAQHGIIHVDAGNDDGVAAISQYSTSSRPQYQHQQPIHEVYVVSNFSYFSALAEIQYLAYGKWETIECIDGKNDPNKRISYETDVQFASTREDVSALYGEAVTYMLQWELHEFVPNVETVVSNGILRLYPHAFYTERKIKELIACLSCEPLSQIDNDKLEKEFAINASNNQLKGLHLIPFMNNRLGLRKKRAIQKKSQSVSVEEAAEDSAESILFPVKVVACKSEDDDIQLNEFLPQIREIYMAPRKRPFHWVYLANAVMAFSNYHEKFRQIGTNPVSYEVWVNEQALQQGLERLRRTMDKIQKATLSYKNRSDTGKRGIGTPACSFERELSVDFCEKNWITETHSRKSVVGVMGVCDWINENSLMQDGQRQPESEIDRYNIDLLEIKFVHQLSNVHRLQVLIYCAMYILEMNSGNYENKNETVKAIDGNTHPKVKICRGMLYNARTGETEICQVGHDIAMDFLLDISQFKYNGKARKEVVRSLATSNPESVNEESEILVPTQSSYKRKRPKKRLGQKTGRTYHTAVEIKGESCAHDNFHIETSRTEGLRSPRSYRVLKRPKKREHGSRQPSGTDNDPIVID